MRHLISPVMILFACCSLLCNSAFSQEKKDEKITYEEHVKPIFRSHCFSCHNQNKKEGDLDVTNYTSLMQGGGSGAVIEPGEVGDSYLFALVNHDEEPAMPPEQPKIPAEKIALLSKWIELGALENSASKAMVKKKKSFDFALTDPAVGKPSVMPLPAKLDRQPVVVAKRPTGVSAMATSPWAPLTAIAGQKQVLLYDSRTRELTGVLPFPEGVISVLKFSRNGSLLLAGGGRGGAKGLVVVWNIKNGERIIEVGDELDTVLAADISSDQKLVALGGPQKMIRVYSTADNSLVYEIKKHTDWVTSMEFSPDGVLLCTGDRNGGVHVWEGFSGREYLTLKGHSQSITGISWRSDSNIVATTSEDATIRLWEMNNGSAVKSWTAHGGGSLGVEFTRDGRLVSCGRDRYAKVWDQAGKQLFAFPAFADIAMSVTHCDESNTCIAGDWTGEIRQFNAADGKQLATLNSNPLKLEERLVAAEKSASQLATQVQQLAAVATADKNVLDQLNKAVADSKAQMAKLTAMIGSVSTKMEADKKDLATKSQQLTTSTQSFNSLAAVLPELTKAKANADLAVTKLPKDAELKAIADSINKILAAKQAEKVKVEAEKNTLAKQVMDLNSGIKTAVDNLKNYNAALAAAKQVIAKSEPGIKPAQEKYAKSKAAADAAAANQNLANAQVASLKEAIEFSKTFRQLTSTVSTENAKLNDLATAHAEVVAKMEESQKVMAEKSEALTMAKSKVDAKTTELNQLKSTLEVKVKTQAGLQAEITSATSGVTMTQATLQHLGQAKAKLEEAQRAAPNDKDVAATLQALVALIATQNQKIATYQSTINAKKAEVEKVQAEMVAMKQAQTTAEKSLDELQKLMSVDQQQLKSAQENVKSLEASAKKAEDIVKAKEQEIAELKSRIAKLQGV